MTRLSGPRRITRGKSYRVRLGYRRPGGAAGTITIPVRAPLGMTKGKRDLVLTGTPSDLASGGGSDFTLDLFGDTSVDETGPRSLAALAREIGDIHRYDGITASFRPRHRRKAGLEPSVPRGELPGGALGRGLRERPVYRDPKLRYSGAVSIPVVVR
jgi:hypothetical protein